LIFAIFDGCARRQRQGGCTADKPMKSRRLMLPPDQNSHLIGETYASERGSHEMEGVSALLGKADIGGLFQLISEICEQLGTGDGTASVGASRLVGLSQLRSNFFYMNQDPRSASSSRQRFDRPHPVRRGVITSTAHDSRTTLPRCGAGENSLMGGRHGNASKPGEFGRADPARGPF
jgi:hypothetical protein